MQLTYRTNNPAYENLSFDQLIDKFFNEHVLEFQNNPTSFYVAFDHKYLTPNQLKIIEDTYYERDLYITRNPFRILYQLEHYSLGVFFELINRTAR